MNAKSVAAFAAGALLTASVAAVLVGEGAAADKVVVYTSATAKVDVARLERLSDGGCEIEAYGSAQRADGGAPLTGTRSKELSGANRTACLDVLDKALLLWKADEGL